MPPGLDNLKHIVVLMMSGRSFDHMLGGLKAQEPRIDGLTGREFNPDTEGREVLAAPLAQFQGQLDPDPSHTFPGVDAQVFDGNSDPSRIPSMQGFVKSYYAQRSDVEHSHAVMYYFRPEKLPVLTSLATEFAVFNRWFSSVPGPVAPNHAFAHFATSFGAVGSELRLTSPETPSLFERLIDGGLSAKLYAADQASGTLSISLLQRRPQLFGTFDQFLADCRTGSLPSYAFLEPRHTDRTGEDGVFLASDQHADHHVGEGERFIAAAYNAIRQNTSLWSSTALLIVYDQHGGLYDHVPPPACVPDGFKAAPSETGTGRAFAFDRLGVRVPAILVSPWIPRATVVDGTVFEHASIPATVTEFFRRDYSNRTAREKSASTFLDLLSLPAMRSDGPDFALAPSTSSKRKRQTGASRASSAAGAVDADQPEASAAPRVSSIAGFGSDVAAGTDLLGITADVERLCAVLAAKDVDPPVSVGLFGDWGSGKTFFMRQMEQRFGLIRTETRKDPAASVFCAEIVQLWFNAWHYIDHNIWASLAAEIFEKLGEALAFDASGEEEKQTVDYQRAELSAQTAMAKAALDETVRKHAAAEEAARVNDEQLVRLEAEAGRLSDNHRFLKSLLQGSLGFAGTQPAARQGIETVRTNLDDKLEQAATALNFPKKEATTIAVKSQLLDLKGVVGRMRALVFAVRHSNHPVAWGLYLVAAVLAIVVVPQLTAVAIRFNPQFARWIVTLLGLAAPAMNLLPQLNRAFTLIDRARDESAAAVQQQYRDELAALGAKREAARKTEERLKADSETQRQDVQRLEDKLEKLRADRQLADFVQRRRESNDYKKHLGVVAQAYADFEQLSLLLAKVKKDGEHPDLQVSGADAPRKLLPRIDRIVLYIDDLDRCPEDKVVDVLQAIHLLLFFPLFVVVVGVDSRWLLHSLRQQSRVFRSTETGDHEVDTERAHWESTPLNYLEKIFQIPFAVRPMGVVGYQRLMDNLTTVKAPASVAKPPVPPGGDAAPPPTATPVTTESTTSATTGDQPSAGATPGATAAPATRIGVAAAEPQPAEKFNPNPGYLHLTDCEREFMKRLLPLIPSPRAAKRFVNVYRLLRTTVGEHETGTFVTDNKDGEYQAVQVLLGVQTGFPPEAMEIIRDLIEQRPEGAWWAFIDRYGRKYKPRSTKRSVSPAPRKRPAPENDVVSEQSTERWREFLEHLQPLRLVMPAASCRDFVKWAPRVARYSFQSARALQYATPQPTKGRARTSE